MNKHPVSFLTDILGRAQGLAVTAMHGEPIDQALAEEVSGELSEFIAHLEGDEGSMDLEAIDPDLQYLAQRILSCFNN